MVDRLGVLLLRVKRDIIVLAAGRNKISGRSIRCARSTVGLLVSEPGWTKRSVCVTFSTEIVK